MQLRVFQKVTAPWKERAIKEVRAGTALLIVDFINPLVGLRAGGFAARALAAARATARLAAYARRARTPVIYANDHLATGSRISAT